MRAGLGTTMATYTVLSIAGSIPLLMPDMISPPALIPPNAADHDSFLVRGVVIGASSADGSEASGDAGAAAHAGTAVEIRLQRQAHGAYARLDEDFWPAPTRRGEPFTLSLAVPFVHSAGSGRFLIVRGADAVAIKVNGRPFPVEDPTSVAIRFDELPSLRNGVAGAVHISFVRDRRPDDATPSRLDVRTNLHPAS